MTTVEALSNSLSRIVTEAFDALDKVGNQESIHKERTLIRRRFGANNTGALPDDKIAKAIQHFNSTNVIIDSKQAYLLCWGLVGSVEVQKPLLEQENFTGLLDELQRCFYDEQLTPLAWRGLLHAYFNYSGMSAESQLGRENWKVLRSFLQRSFEPLCRQVDPEPVWVAVLRENENLLGESPLAPYLEASLSADNTAIDYIITVLAIPKTSWFVGEVILSRVNRVCAEEDEDFKTYLPDMLLRLAGHEIYLDMGLALLLDRYQQCIGSAEQEALSAFAQEHWGNPKLAPNETWKSQWGLVHAQTKAMVVKWLVARDIRDFFSHFQQDGQVDSRRMDFWLRYPGNIQDVYFVLGASVFREGNAGFKRFMMRNSERVLSMESTFDMVNNAFIMLMGEYAIVELGTSDDACYCFNRSKLPFLLDSLSLKGNSEELNDDLVAHAPFPLMHADTNRWGAWENGFAYELRQLGIQPS